MSQLPEKSIVGTKKDPDRTATLQIVGFSKGAIVDALHELMAIERLPSLSLLELMIAERARAHGIDLPEVKAEEQKRRELEAQERRERSRRDLV